jgi:hypothetical protein
VTFEQRESIVRRFSERYRHLGQLLVDDDECLYRLLGALGVATTDPDLGEYLASFLTT